MTKLTTLFLTLALLAAPLAAAPNGTVTLDMESAMEKVETGKDGKQVTRLVPVTKVVPGDEVIYTINYRNDGREVANPVVISNALPKEMSFRDGTAFGAGATITFSVDGGKTFGPAEALRMPLPNGGTRPATGADYTNIRFLINNPVAPGQKGFVRYRAQLK
jgi:uncharacterized repeat protein (TIGR01451 family)